MDTTHLPYLRAIDLLQALQRRELSSVEATEAALARIDRLNPRFHAYLTVCHDEALAAAKAADAAKEPLGPLHGLPISIKDLLYLKGVRCTGGSLVYQDLIADRDAPVVAWLKEAGAVILGKTNTPEFGVTAITENRLGPPCGNPWDASRTPGGSSGGAGTAAALGLGALHLGTDGGGSIRIPASFCGVFGIKPTIGRVPPYTREWGGYGAWPTMSQAGPMTRYVEDAALMLDVMSGPVAGDPFAIRAKASFRAQPKERLGLRIAWSPDMGFAAVDPEVRALVEGAARTFVELGCEVEEATPKVDDALLTSAFLPIAASGDAAAHGILLDSAADKLADYTRPFLEAGMKVKAVDVVHAEQRRLQIWRLFDEFLSRYDLLLTPVLATPAFPIGQPPDAIDGKAVRPFAWMPFTAAFNLTGQPAASVPCGFTKAGLPVGLHVIARAFREQTILDASLAYQQARPWHDRRPQEA